MQHFVIEGTKKGICPLCQGKAARDKDLFVVKGPFSGPVCPAHLLVLAQQNGKPEGQ